jgi:hypothetical protein
MPPWAGSMFGDLIASLLRDSIPKPPREPKGPPVTVGERARFAAAEAKRERRRQRNLERAA